MDTERPRSTAQNKENSSSPSDLSIRSEGRHSSERAAFSSRLEEIQSLLDLGQSSEVQSRVSLILRTPRLNPSVAAEVRCAGSVSLEMQGRYAESLEAVALYEAAESRLPLDSDVASRVRVQLALAYNYNGDHPRAIALLNAELRDATESGTDCATGAAFIALSRTYRSINEYSIARGYADKALDHYRRTGEWRGLAESYFAIALTELFEGRYESSLSQLQQALKIIGEHKLPYLLGKIYTNMAGACWFLKRPQDGIAYLEKAVGYYERTEHKANAIDGYNNLGETLILVGDWERGRQSLERALELASEFDERGAKLPMILDSLGELYLRQGELDGAREHLERAAFISEANGNKWYAWQPLRSMGHLELVEGHYEIALEFGQRVLQLGEKIGDRQAMAEARLVLAESFIGLGRNDEAAAELRSIDELVAEAGGNLAVTGASQILLGALNLAEGNSFPAIQHYGRGISIFQLLGDRYHCAKANLGMAICYLGSQPHRASEHLESARQEFEKFGARLDLDAVAALSGQLQSAANSPVKDEFDPARLLELLALRLADASMSRELLLRELGSVLKEEAGVSRLLVLDLPSSGNDGIVFNLGFDDATAMARAAFNEGDMTFPSGLQRILIKPASAPAAALILDFAGSGDSHRKLPTTLLVRIVEMGLENCALKDREKSLTVSMEPKQSFGQSLLQGFIHASPAMDQLVGEILKIRSSDVTALVTGESGTGKELVARAIHANSARRSRVFVPFNCTAVPRELSDAFLFGYKKGAFTGAVSDSPGVIRAASGGTLFLDEIGDLPLDIQPKLLRFLQNGEIQPLGEQRPVTVDVRVIAATNTNLEEMVAEGRFREDLYYRLNVIRLEVPPLRTRRSEIPAIVTHYLEYYSRKFGKQGIAISPQAMDLLMVGEWPGNVRQLTNEVQRLVARAEDMALITPDHLSAELRRTPVPDQSGSRAAIDLNGKGFWEGMSMPDAVDQLEKLMISATLEKHNGNISRTARDLGITRRGLQLKLARY